MVAFTTMRWLSEMGVRFGDTFKRSLSNDSPKANPLGILSFETAKTMSRIVSLYRSFSDDQILNLRKIIMKSEGVTYLNSKDEGVLLSLACAERLEDLDKAATAVARLGHKCSDFGLNRFDLVYTDLKLGIIDFGKLEYGSKEIDKKIDKMESLVSATSFLHAALEGLTELEVSERKLKMWKNSSAALQSQKANFDLFDQKIAFQRKQVRNFRESSLWSQSFDKSVGLMARIICIVYARLCVVFGPYIPILPHVSLPNSSSSPHQKDVLRPEFCSIQLIREQLTSHSGPIPTTSKPSLVRFYSRKSILFSSDDTNSGTNNNRVFHAAGSSTVGGSGLALRYANVILLADKYLDTAVTIGDDAREALYLMLPENLKTLVRSKLVKNSKTREDDELLAEGWREALKGIMGWLVPVAQDTLKWHLERNFEKMKFDSKPSTLLLQTLHFSDIEKTEAAIAEVLVGLSCIYMYEHRRTDELSNDDTLHNRSLIVV